MLYEALASFLADTSVQDVSCIAWGLSLERPTMILYGIDNIRDLFGHKVFAVCNGLCGMNILTAFEHGIG